MKISGSTSVDFILRIYSYKAISFINTLIIKISLTIPAQCVHLTNNETFAVALIKENF